MKIELKPLASEDVEYFCTSIQESFQLAVESVEGEEDNPVLPREDIDETFAHPQAVPLMAWYKGEKVGGVVIYHDPDSEENDCALLYVNAERHNEGIGASLWKAVEEYFPHTRIWKLCTPYFEKRNIKFYLKKCGFRIVDLYEDSTLGKAMPDSERDWMFSFVKHMDGKW